MYQDFTLKNLQQVKMICFDGINQTLYMSLAANGDGSQKINMAFTRGGTDDKTIGIRETGLLFIVDLMEQITGKKFRAGEEYNENLRVFVADD